MCHTCLLFAPLQVALAVSLNLRTYLGLKATTTGTVCVNLPNIDTVLCWDLSELKQFIPSGSGNGKHTMIYPFRPNGTIFRPYVMRYIELFLLIVCAVISGAGGREEVKLLDQDLVRRLREFVGVNNGNLNTSQMATLSFLYLYLSVFRSG